MLRERLCGLKQWDKAVDILDRREIIDGAISRYKRVQTQSYNGWWVFAWSIGNEVRNAAKSSPGVSMSWNLDDVLTIQEMQYVSKQCKMGAYVPVWKRK